MKSNLSIYPRHSNPKSTLSSILIWSFLNLFTPLSAFPAIILNFTRLLYYDFARSYVVIIVNSVVLNDDFQGTQQLSDFLPFLRTHSTLLDLP